MEFAGRRRFGFHCVRILLLALGLVEARHFLAQWIHFEKFISKGIVRSDRK